MENTSWLSNTIEENIKGTNRMGWGTDLGLFTINKVESTVDSGSIIKWKEEERSIILVET